MVLLAFFVICALATIAFDRAPRPLPAGASLSSFSAERAARHLASISRAPHPINSAEHDAVRDYVLGVLRGLALSPEVQRTTVINERYGIPGAVENIVCRLKGSTQEKAVLLVAHYDSVAAGPGASDDGSAVAALLEGARTLQALPQLKRDVILLFTDGEEKGLLGARAFVLHPWAKDVGFVLNFEARGNSGPSIMFETSDRNGWLIRNFGKAASHPVANSLSYEIYKRLPNDTDFTVFRRAGFSGLNFAFIDGLGYYHTSQDSIQNMDLGSLQHQGDYLIELTSQLGNETTDDPRPANVVYFDVLGEIFVNYGSGMARFILGLTSMLVVLVLYLGYKRGLLKPARCGVGVACMLLGVAITVLGAWIISWITLAIKVRGVQLGLRYHPGAYILFFSAIGVACGVAFYAAVCKRVGSENVAAGALLGWLVLAIAVSIYIPGASYICVWPLFFTALGWAAIFARKETPSSRRNAFAALGGIPAIVLVIPMVHKIFFAFAARSTLIVSVFLGLLLALLIGQIAAELPERWIPTGSGGTGGKGIISFFLQHSRKAVLLSMIAAIISGACNAALLGVINAALKNNSFGTMLLWTFCGLCGLLPLARFTSERLLTGLGQKAMYTSRMKLCQQVLAAPLGQLERIGAARLLTTLTDDIPNITGAVSVIPIICINAALVIGCLIYMASLSPLLFLVVGGFMVIGIATYQIPILRVQKIFRRARKDADTLSGHLRALTHGIKELKVHCDRRQAFVSEQLEVTADSLMRNNISAFSLYAGAASWGQTLVFVVVGFSLFVLPRFSHTSSITLTGYTLTLLYLMTPLQVIMNTMPQLGRANVALRTVQELGFTLAQDQPEEMAGGSLSLRHWRRLELRSVTHAYKRENEPESFILGPIKLAIESGELVFITGGNGSGKTTLVKLITGLYMAETGHIYLDSQRIEDDDREQYRQFFSVVFADFYLFEHLLGLARPDLEEEARRYLAELKLSQTVKVIGNRFSTTELSQGQRKRLALLTAYLEDRPIYVFDEWAADQDPYFKNIFYTHLLPQLKSMGKTVLVITHDDRYYHVADRVIRLDEGQIVSDSRRAPASFELAHGSSSS